MEIKNDESSIFGVSMRGWIAAFIILTICIMSFLAKEITEPLYSMALVALGFFYGQKSVKQKNVE